MSNIQANINGYAHSRGTDLVPVPVENLEHQMALRVLQVQVFTLADEVAKLSKEIEQLRSSLR